MSVPKFKDAVNIELRLICYDAFHITVLYEEGIYHFL